VRRQDFGVLFLYYIGYSALRTFLLSFQRKRVAVFVYFHDVLPENARRFRANMRFLKDSTNVISMRDFLLGRLAPGKWCQFSRSCDCRRHSSYRQGS
jgi:hypothetical protein